MNANWVLAEREKVLGKGHPDTLMSITSLRLDSREARQVRGGGETHRRVGGREMHWGESPDTLMSGEQSRAASQEAGEVQEAEKCTGLAWRGERWTWGKGAPCHSGQHGQSRLSSQETSKYERRR